MEIKPAKKSKYTKAQRDDLVSAMCLRAFALELDGHDLERITSIINREFDLGDMMVSRRTVESLIHVESIKYGLASMTVDVDTPLEMEDWLEQEVYPGMNMEEFIGLECAESGADREGDFNLESVQEERYDKYVTAHSKTGV